MTAHNYEDELFADQFISVTRRDVTDDHKDYVNLRLPETRVSLFVRSTPREDFVYAGELKYLEHTALKDPSSGRPQMRYVWRLKNPLPEPLYQELTFGLPKTSKASGAGKTATAKSHSHAPSSFDELRKAYSYVLGTAERTVIPEQQNYQVRLGQFLKDRGVAAEGAQTESLLNHIGRRLLSHKDDLGGRGKLSDSACGWRSYPLLPRNAKLRA